MQFPSFPHRKIFLTALVLVIVSVSVLVAQNTPPSKEAAPEEPKQRQNVMQPSVFSKLLEVDIVNPLVKQIEGLLVERFKKEPGFVSTYAISPDGKQIAYRVYFHNTFYELHYFKQGMNNPKMIEQTGVFENSDLAPFEVQYWLDNSKILLETRDLGLGDRLGIVIYDVATFTGQKLSINNRYLSTPIPYENNTKLFYEVLGGDEPMNMESPLVGERLFYIYDLTEKREIQIPDIPQEVQQKVTNKQSFAPDGQNFFDSSPENGTNGCSLPGAPIFYLPWPCNKAMCVERDGPQQCTGATCTSDHDLDVEYSDCPLLNNGSNYLGACNNCPSTCGHTSPAIDFGDRNLWYQTGTPVLASANGEAQKRASSGTAGNYVIIRHQRIGYPANTYVYSHYMHLNSFTGNIPVSPNWGTIYRGDQIGTEGNTGLPPCVPANEPCGHYHFQLRDADVSPAHSFYPIFAEYGGCTPKTGRTYISKNVPTAPGSMQLGYDCNSVTTLQSCNTSLANQTTVGSASRYATYGNSYHSWDEYGPERVYKLTTTSTGTITATLSNLSFPPGGNTDLDVFILKSSSGSCANLDPIVDCVSTSSGVTATYANAPAGTYFIVVEGYNGSAGSYTLNVTASCGGSGGLNCNNAIPLSNGVAYNGNNNGGGNNATTYNCQSGWSETGPEKVHSYYHTGGTITVNLAQSVDVDAFLLGSCSPTNCLLGFDNGVASSSQPAGTYYIVVDGYNGAVGSYNLTVSSTSGGGFNCNNAVPLSNGIAYNGSNAGGGNNATIYNCQSGWSETGPEKVHSYYHTGGTITINLGQSVDVDAFLLGSCSPTNCLLGFDNGVASSSQPAGTYYIVVDGYQGAVGNYTLTVSSSGGGGSNDNICGATALSVNSSCISTNGTNVGATPSTPAPNSACPISGYKDVWFKFTMPNVATPQVTIRTMAGSLDDAVMEVHYGTCSSPIYIVCEDDNTNGNGSRMPVINLQGGANATIWVRVWGWNGGTGTFSICVLNYYSPNFGDEGNLITIPESASFEETGDLSATKGGEDRSHSISTHQKVNSCEVTVNDFNITVMNVELNSEYLFYNALGQVVCHGKATDGTIQCRASTPGIYFMSIVDAMGNRCTQKVFVN